MTTKQFNNFFNNLDKIYFEQFWRTHSATDVAKEFNLRDYREAKKVALLLNITRTPEEAAQLKIKFSKKCSRPGAQNRMYGKSAMLGRKHSAESKEKMSLRLTGLITIHKDLETKHIHSKDLDTYLADGWVKGESDTQKK